MRGGNRQRPRSEPGHKPPRPPRDLLDHEARIWREIAVAVAKLGTYKPSDLVFFRLTVRTVAEAESAAAMPPTARARVLQAAGSMLSAFGLSPLARERIEVPKDNRSVAERILDAAMRGKGR